jgi:predicted O-methyltransferase YrrM
MILDIQSAVSAAQGDALASLAADKDVLEIGSEFGFATIRMAEVARRVVSIDWHRGDGYSGYKDSLGLFMDNIKRYGVLGVVLPIVARVEDIGSFLADGRFDLVFVDGDHGVLAVLHDCELARRVAKTGGVVAVHDCGNLSGVEETARSVLGVPEDRVETMAMFRVMK